MPNRQDIPGLDAFVASVVPRLGQRQIPRHILTVLTDAYPYGVGPLTLRGRVATAMGKTPGRAYYASAIATLWDMGAITFDDLDNGWVLNLPKETKQ